MPELGLFPLPIVLLPTERVPLHIFEPRYRELIAECLENGSEFGLMLATERRRRPRDRHPRDASRRCSTSSTTAA